MKKLENTFSPFPGRPPVLPQEPPSKSRDLFQITRILWNPEKVSSHRSIRRSSHSSSRRSAEKSIMRSSEKSNSRSSEVGHPNPDENSRSSEKSSRRSSERSNRSSKRRSSSEKSYERSSDRSCCNKYADTCVEVEVNQSILKDKNPIFVNGDNLHFQKMIPSSRGSVMQYGRTARTARTATESAVITQSLSSDTIGMRYTTNCHRKTCQEFNLKPCGDTYIMEVSTHIDF